MVVPEGAPRPVLVGLGLARGFTLVPSGRLHERFEGRYPSLASGAVSSEFGSDERLRLFDAGKLANFLDDAARERVFLIGLYPSD